MDYYHHLPRNGLEAMYLVYAVHLVSRVITHDLLHFDKAVEWVGDAFQKIEEARQA